jgi:hypothetical protein
MKPHICCELKYLKPELWMSASNRAIEINPVNFTPLSNLLKDFPDLNIPKERLSVVTTKYWHTKGVNLTVGFFDSPDKNLKSKILSHMNAWAKTANVKFVESNENPQVRISRDGTGYWSYLGTDILSIAEDLPTMNLEGFTINTLDSEFYRVVRHETGHTLGCPHEHMRKEFVDKIDVDAAIAFFSATQGWSELEVHQQVLTPIEESSLLGTLRADGNSIMCYQIPGTITKDKSPILGGVDIDEMDYEFMGKIYPK